MIIFGVPTPMTVGDQVERAYLCVKAMQIALTALNEEWQRAEHYTFHTRISMHCGPAIACSFGGPQRADYTAVGHTVNLASRVETMADADDIVMTEAVAAWLPDGAWEPIGSFNVRGPTGKASFPSEKI